MALSLRRCVAVLALTMGTLSSPAGAQDMYARDGWEAFVRVDYIGGDARFTKKGYGVLVLTDSTLGFYNCAWNYCVDRKGKIFDEAGVIWKVPLTKITRISASTQNQGASAGNRVLFGVLASDTNAEYFAFAHDTETSAEAPVFKTPKTISGALDAKVRFKMRKLGINLPQ